MSPQVHWQPGVTLDQLEKSAVLEALRYCKGNKTQAASTLGISVRTLYNKLESYGMKEEMPPELAQAVRDPMDHSSGLHPMKDSVSTPIAKVATGKKR